MPSAPRVAAICSRDSSSRRLACWPALWIEDGVADDRERSRERLDGLGQHRGGGGVVEIGRHAPSSRSPPAAARRSGRRRGSACIRTTVEPMSAPDPLHDLGVRAGADGGEHPRLVGARDIRRPRDLRRRRPRLGVRAHPADPRRARRVEGASAALVPGARYGLRVDGPAGFDHAFNPVHSLLDPYARGLAKAPTARGAASRSRRSTDDGIRLGRRRRSRARRSTTRSSTRRTCAASRSSTPRSPSRCAAPTPVSPTTRRSSTSPGSASRRSSCSPCTRSSPSSGSCGRGELNYWGYNTLAFFAAHAPYASAAAQAEGAHAVRREFAGMVRRLHEAGLEVILDVVYNHTAEEGRQGPTYSFRGIDNAAYYRHDAHGRYVDTTGCGNTLDFGRGAPQRLVLDSMRYFAEELQVDGFRLDLAATLGRDDHGGYTPEHPLLRAMLEDPVLAPSKLIAEPWDVGPGGWQTGNFPAGLHRVERPLPRPHARLLARRPAPRARRRARPAAASAASPPGSRARRTRSRSSAGPLASLNFITAHDGFTLADLTAYDVKHNLGNGEQNRDGTDNNNSYNHGVEGQTDDPAIRAARRRSHPQPARHAAAVGGRADAHRRRRVRPQPARQQQRVLPRLDADVAGVGRDDAARRRHRSRRRGNSCGCAPRTPRCARCGSAGSARPRRARRRWTGSTPRATTMTIDDWNSPGERTLQYLAASTPEFEEFNRILLVVHAQRVGDRGRPARCTRASPGTRCCGIPPTRRPATARHRARAGRARSRCRATVDAPVPRDGDR